MRRKFTYQKIFVTILLGLFSITVWNHLIAKAIHAHATEITPAAIEVLVPGQNHDTGEHDLVTEDFKDPNRWIFSGRGVGASDAGWISGTTYFRLQNGRTDATNGSASWGIYDGGIDFTKEFKINMYLRTLKSSNPGDSLGFIFSPVSVSNIKNGGAGAGLGIRGLPYSVFVGRDFYYNGASYGDINRYYPNQVRIAETNENGEILLSGTATTGIRPIGSESIVTSGSGDMITILWEPSGQTNTNNQTIKGSLTAFFRNTVLKYEQELELQSNMSFGIVSATAGGASEMYGDVRDTIVSGTKGTSTVEVNYINSRTNQKIVGMDKTTITANISDTIGINQAGNSNADYIFEAPAAPSGYAFDHADGPLTVENFKVGTANPNQLNIYYQPQEETALLSYHYLPGTPGTSTIQTAEEQTEVAIPGDQSNGTFVQGNADTSLPLKRTFRGFSGDVITIPTQSNDVPIGYQVSKVRFFSGNQTNVQEFVGTDAIEQLQNINATFVSGLNNIVVLVEAAPQIANFNIVYEPSDPSAPPLPQLLTVTGVTGGVLEYPKDQIIVALPKNYEILSITAPDGVSYPTIEDVAANNPYFLATRNDFLIKLKFKEFLTFSSVPNQLNFGSHKLSLSDLRVKAVHDTAFIVTDTRQGSQNNGWVLSAKQNQSLINNGVTLSYVNRGGDVIEVNDQFNIIERNRPEKPTEEIISDEWKNADKGLFLEIPSSEQKIGSYNGTRTWSLQSVPTPN